MLDEDRGRHGTPVQDFEADTNQAFAIPLRKVGDGTDKASVWFAEFRSSLRRGILPHHGAAFRASRFLKGPKRAQSAGVVDRPYQHAAGTGSAQMLAHLRQER